MCMYVCVYVCMCVYVYMCMCVCVLCVCVQQINAGSKVNKHISTKKVIWLQDWVNGTKHQETRYSRSDRML